MDPYLGLPHLPSSCLLETKTLSPKPLSPKPLNPETPKLRKNSAPEVGPLQERPSIGDQILAQPRPLLALLRVYRASGLGPIEV